MIIKKIIHLSDLHLGHDGCFENLLIIIRMIIFLKEPACNYVVVITGDVVDDVTKTGYFTAVKMLNLLKSEGFDVLVVPGNHDYGTGGHAFSDYVPIFKESFFGDASITYPKLNIIGDVAFIGLDSNENELGKVDSYLADGELGKAQLKRLDEMLNSKEVTACAKRVVYLHHHPFETIINFGHRLKDSDELQKIIAGKVDALLFGHNHGGKVYNGKWNIPRCYDAGTSTGKKGKVGAHRVIDLSKEVIFDYDGNFLG